MRTSLIYRHSHDTWVPSCQVGPARELSLPGAQFAVEDGPVLPPFYAVGVSRPIIEHTEATHAKQEIRIGSI